MERKIKIEALQGACPQRVFTGRGGFSPRSLEPNRQGPWVHKIGFKHPPTGANLWARPLAVILSADGISELSSPKRCKIEG
jgi:hypothetical protein